MTIRKILVLGGTTEGNQIAKSLLAKGGFDVTTSLAGATHNPRILPGKVRTGGFGGPEKLSAWLQKNQIDALIDATHPFATRIKKNARAASREARVPAVTLVRPQWLPVEGDNWTNAANIEDAVAALPALMSGREGRALLAIGKKHVRAFRNMPGIPCVVRTVDPTVIRVPFSSAIFIQERGPFTVEGERQMFKKNNVTCVVCRNAGGQSSFAKVRVAREMGLPVLMISRPDKPKGRIVETVEEAVWWLETVL